MKSEKLTEKFPSSPAQTHYIYSNLKTCKISQNLLLKLDTVIQKYLEQAQDVAFNENVLL
jgi:hypothetical protein